MYTLYNLVKSEQEKSWKIPVVDLFAGPGGLGEGFASLPVDNNSAVFKIILSVEKDPVAHKTLELRSFFRQFSRKEVPEEYYQYLRGKIKREALFEKFPKQAAAAQAEAWCATLGSGDDLNKQLDARIRDACKNHGDKWVLIGGPPCQAYSMVGRSRRRNIKDYSPETDERTFLYKEYLRILSEHQPAVFIMENVKGLLSSKVNGNSMFQKILSDLQRPECTINCSKNCSKTSELEYRIYSLTVPFNNFNPFMGSYAPKDFIIESEKYGVPQTRHRVIFLGVKKGFINFPPEILQIEPPVSTKEVLDGLPSLRSGLSKEKDSQEKWSDIILQTLDQHWFEHGLRAKKIKDLQDVIINALAGLEFTSLNRGGEFVEWPVSVREDLAWWYLDDRLGGACNHFSRAHMNSDLHRYLFAACFAKEYGQSPKMLEFPTRLLPDHKNAKSGHFDDRFKVQLAAQAASTITSHISKDGHYFIHYDPTQCRSLTVREAARLQTFPDNYFFEGPRTQQYIQVGNAVPPLLARKIADIVRDIFQKETKD